MNHDAAITALQAQHAAAKDRLAIAAGASLAAGAYLAASREAVFVGQEIARDIQQRAHDKIASVVTRCIQTVFEEDIDFRIVFEAKANRTEAKLVFVKDGMEINPLDESGGGLVDVAAFALRLACLMLSQPAKRRTMILDEPFRFLSKEYRPKMRDLIWTLAKEMECQFVIVTHITEMQIGTVIEIG